MNMNMPPRALTLEARIDSLRRRHRRLDDEIASEQRRPAPDAMRLRRLKSRKLILKDEMTYYAGVLRTIEPRPEAG